VAPVGHIAGKQRRRERVEKRLPRSPRIVDLEVLGSREQEPRSVAPSLGRKGHPGSEDVQLGTLIIVYEISLGPRGEFQRGIECAGLPLGFSGCERSSNSLIRIDGKFSGSLEECCRCGKATACLSPPGRKFEGRCHFVVRMPRGLRKVPGAAVRVEAYLSGFGECSVHVASVTSRSSLVDSRTDQGMAKNDSWCHFQQAISFTRGGRGLVESEVLSGAPYKSRIARRLGRRHEEKTPRG
jgi:hypothetical protein